MSELAHEEIEELLGAYSLDAVDPDERAAVDAHLPDCPRCRAEVAELREVAALLANNDTDAPEGVWDRIVEAIDEEPPPMRIDVGRQGHRDRVPLLLSAAAIVAILLLGWQVLDLRSENDRIQKQVAAADATRAAVDQVNLALLEPNSRVVRMTGADDQRALAVVTEDGTGYMLAIDLPPLDSGVYELWGADSNGTLTALGSTEQPGVMKFDAGSDVAKLLVTVEPSVVDQPTTSPIMQGTVV